MRIQILTVLGVCWLCSSVVAQTQPNRLHADRVVVLKKERIPELLSQGHVIKTYKVALGGNPIGPKMRQGDHKTPEGLYALDFRNAHSQSYRSIHISYPSAHDRAEARKRGVSPGGDVFVHGLPNSLRLGGPVASREGLDGCIALTNPEIDQIWQSVTDGTPIEIRP